MGWENIVCRSLQALAIIALAGIAMVSFSIGVKGLLDLYKCF